MIDSANRITSGIKSTTARAYRPRSYQAQQNPTLPLDIREIAHELDKIKVAGARAIGT
jgi:hypothetical protein